MARRPAPPSDDEVDRLVEAAGEARPRAHAPYSRFKVGAAVLGPDGRVYAGCNVENASSPSGLCAEQTAVARAVAEGAGALRAVAVVVRAPRPLAPCGRCRQVLAEFGPRLHVILATTGGRRERTTLDVLLPAPFRRRA